MWFNTMVDSAPVIGYAISEKGQRWRNLPPITTLKGHADPCVILDSSSCTMYYTSAAAGSGSAIKMASSPDGVHWDAGNMAEALHGDSSKWDGFGVSKPNVIIEDGMYKMWYEGSDSAWSSIGYATSFDGVHWSKFARNPVLVHSNRATDIDYLTAGRPVVVHEDSIYYLFYAGTDDAYRTAGGYATSRDGIRWKKSPKNPVLRPGEGSWDGRNVSFASVMLTGKHFRAWYSGESGDGELQIGLATSTLVKVVVKSRSPHVRKTKAPRKKRLF